ncbi:MAG: MFS transporter [Candidatus Paceibacterota bacterium]
MFKRIFLFFFTYMAAMYFSQTLIVFWLSKNGFNFSNIIIFFVTSYIVAFLGIFVLSKIRMNLKPTILLGVLLSALSVVVLIKIFSVYQLYFSAILTGFNVIFFWIPYNIMHFKFSNENKRGLNSGIYFLATPIISMTLQPLAGLVAEKFGFETMFFIGIAMYLIPIFLIRFLPNFEIKLNIIKEFRENKFNWSTFFQGFASRINWTLIPIFTLFFIKSPKAFGSFFGYLAIITAITSLFNAAISDKMKNRKIFFYLFTSLAVLSLIPLAFVENIYYWAIFAGITSMCMYLANPFWLAFNLDYYKEIGVEKTIILREVFLNAGYILALFIAVLIFYITSSTKISLLIVSLIACVLPLASYLQGVYRNKNI